MKGIECQIPEQYEIDARAIIPFQLLKISTTVDITEKVKNHTLKY